MSRPQFSLINLAGPGTFTFALFPRKVATQERANWQPQETTVGVKPLFYANRDPRRITVDELYLDSTDTGASLTPTIKELRQLLAETEKGTPPPLLAVWGDRQERCVLSDLTIEEQFFDTNGNPLRVMVRLELTQLQPEGARTSSRVVEDSDSAPVFDSSLGNF